MADGSHIEWTDATWNIITGCSVTSPGCTNCYAMRLAGTRLHDNPSRKGLTQDTKAGPVWTGEVRFNEQWLEQPLRWRRPRRIFVCAHGDLFYEQVPDEWIDRMFAVMALAPQHQYQILTKRSSRMRTYIADRGFGCGYWEHWAKKMLRERSGDPGKPVLVGKTLAGTWPWPHVWLGVSVEDQQRADERIPDLLATPAAVRFISAEPLLGPIDLRALYRKETLTDALGVFEAGDRMVAINPKYEDHARIDWVIAGGESGPGARPMHPAWVRSLRDQCQAAGVPFFFKQWGEWAVGDHGKSDADDCVLLGLNNVVAHAARNTWPPIGEVMQRVGKRDAGRLLDGRTWDEFPR